MKRYFLIFFLAFPLIYGCQSDGDQPVSPESLLTEMIEQRRFASADQLADWIIQKDPSLLLVDVRSPEAFGKFALPGAINIPLAELTNPEQQAQLDCEKYLPVFYANGTVLAEKAWVINRRLGCKNGLVLKGGLNEWTATILDPAEPPPTASSEAFELYQFRKAASLYFAGGSKSLEAEPYYEAPKATAAPKPTAAKKTVPVKPKKVEEEEEEGC